MISPDQIKLLTSHLSQYISEHKREYIERVLSERTRHVTIVLEDIFQSQNASAVFRTAECFGIQDIHLIENLNKYSVNKRVLKGANKWLTIHRHNSKSEDNTNKCLQSLKQQGYTVLATMPSATTSIAEINVSGKVALLMGNELHGLSSNAIELADVKVRIPMYGFTESLNLSVSAALCVNTVIDKMRQNTIDWQLAAGERECLKLDWYRKVVRNSNTIERLFLKSIE